MTDKITDDKPIIENKKKKTTISQNPVKPTGFCVYVGPSITGVIQSGSIYRGTKEQVLKELQSAIERYPLISTLVIQNDRLSKDRTRVKTPGNILYVNYHRILSDMKEGK